MATAKQSPVPKKYPDCVYPIEMQEFPDLNPDLYPAFEFPKDMTKLQGGLMHITSDMVRNPKFIAKFRSANIVRNSASWQNELGRRYMNGLGMLMDTWEWGKDDGLNNAHNRAQALAKLPGAGACILINAVFGVNPKAYRWYDAVKQRDIAQVLYQELGEKRGWSFQDTKRIAAATRWLNLYWNSIPLDSRIGITREERLDKWGFDIPNDFDEFTSEQLNEFADAAYRQGTGGDADQIYDYLKELKSIIKHAPRNAKGKAMLPMRETMLLSAYTLGSRVNMMRAKTEQFFEAIITRSAYSLKTTDPRRVCMEYLLQNQLDDGKIEWRVAGSEQLTVTLICMRHYFDGEDIRDGEVKFVHQPSQNYDGWMVGGYRWNDRLIGGAPRLSEEEDKLFLANEEFERILRDKRRVEARLAEDTTGTTPEVDVTVTDETALVLLDMSKTTYKVISVNGGVKTVGELRNLPQAKLFGIKGVTAKVYNELKEVLGGYGLVFKK